MTTPVAHLLGSKSTDNEEELIAKLESLPSYETSQETQEESAIFEDDSEPSTGLISLIRRNSVPTSQSTTVTTNEVTSTVRIILE